MKNLRKSILSLVVILLLVASAFIPSYAATSQPASYSSESNSGQRDVICTTLDGTSASSYYTGSYQYDLLSTQSASDIQAALSTLMTTTHTNITSYNDCRDYVFQVDCENNDTSKATTLYTSHQMTSSEWSPTWSCNREHVWPQSLGGKSTSGGGADLHHIRPAEASVNSSRGSSKYGNYIPADNVKGDVARICLYVMVRWGADWGATDITQVFTSVDLLLEWCELDPVDTWEMGRNEVVEDIQGNRNVFIDYPEYAWLIFGEEVPDDMVTPSGEAMSQTSSGTPSVGTGNGSSSNVNNSLGATAVQEVDATISFDSTAQRTSHTTAKQVWTNGGVTFTNDKAASTTNVGDYSNPVRIYAHSSITIDAPGHIKTITVVCSSNNYATVLKNSVGAEASVNGSTVTITPTTQSTSYTVKDLTEQTRFKSITVVYAQACTHTNTTTNTVNATCTTAGSTTVTCDDCGKTISTTPISATGHNYVGGKCENCGSTAQSYTVSFVSPTKITTVSTNGSVTMEVAPTHAGHTFVGWSTNAVENATTTKPTVYQPGAVVTVNSNTTFYAVFSYTQTGESTTEYVKKELADITSNDVVVITMQNSSGVYAMSNDKGTSAAPSAVKVTVSNNKLSGNIADNIKWNISNNSGNLTIYPNGTTSKWLYCTSTNNGVRVGTNAAKVFTIDSSSGYLKHTGTGRYLGVYNSQDWRCYTNTTGNTAGQTLAFYVLTTTAASETYYVTFAPDECQHVNKTETTIDATCTQDGLITVTCKDCEEVVSTTPISATGHQHTTSTTVDATCTTAGSITVTCEDCKEVISTTPLPTKDHDYVDGSCSVCGASKPADSMGLDGNKFYIAAIRSSGNYFYMTSDLGTASTKRYQAHDSGLSALPAFITSAEQNNGYIFVFELISEGKYYIYAYGVDGDEKYLGYTSGNSGTLVSKENALKFTVNKPSNAYNISFANGNDTRYLELNSTSNNNYFAFYTGTQIKNLTLIPVVEPCTHTNTTTTNVDATCTQDGSITVTCTDCEDVVSTTIIPATGHNYVGGTCTGCGDTQILETLGLDGKQFYIFTIRTTGRYIYMSCDLGSASTKRYTAVDSKLTTLPSFIAPDLASNEYVFVFEYNSDDGTYYIYSAGVDGDAKYLGHDGSSNSGLLVAKADAVRLTVDENDGVYTIHYTVSDKERYLALNKNTGSDYFAFYESEQKQDLHLIPIAPVGACAHTSSSVYTTVQVTCTAGGETVSVCDACKNLLDIHEVTALGHDTVDGICARCGYTEDYTPPTPDPSDGGWTLVTDASQLKAGDRIIIVSISQEHGSFIAGNISNSIMASVALSGSTITTLPTDAIEFTLGGSSGSWTFTNDSGKLLGATAVKKMAWGSGTTTWSISIDANGNATIQNSTEAYGRILYNVSYTRFTTYTSGTSSSMLLPQIYKYSGEQSDAQEDVKIYGASMTVGTNLAMNYYVSGCKGTNYYMVCTMNGVESEQIACEEKFGYLVFSFKNIPPQMMGDTISAMIYDSEGNALLDAPFEFSVKEYADKVLDAYSDNEDVTNIVADMLKYGAAAQKYIGYNLNSLVIGDGDCDDMGSTLLPSASDNVRSITTEDTEIDTSEYAFTAAGVRFDFDNKIYVKFKATGDGEVTLKCNGKNAVKKELEDGTYIYYTDGISATDFDKVYTFELFVDGELHQTLVYSVNSYAYAKQNSQDTELADLVIALYRYGLSAKAYKGE